MKKMKICVRAGLAVFCALCFVILNPLKAFSFDVTAVGSFQVSDLTTNFGSGNDSIDSQGVLFTNNGFSAGTDFGGGVLLSQYFIPGKASIESGFLYIPRNMNETQGFFVGSTTGTVSESLSFYYWQIPVLVRLHFQDIFSVAFGGYYAHSMGNIKYTYSSSNSTVQAGLPSGTQYANYQSFGISQSDLGLLYAMGAKVPLGSTPLSLYGDARFILGLKNIQTSQLTSVNLANSPDNNKWRDFQLLVGLSYSFGASAKASTPPSTDEVNKP